MAGPYTIVLFLCILHPSMLTPVFPNVGFPEGIANNNTCPCKTDEIVDMLKAIKTNQVVMEDKISLLKEQLLTKMLSQDTVFRQEQQTLQKQVAEVKTDLNQMNSQLLKNQKLIQSLSTSPKTTVKKKCPLDYTLFKDSCYKVVRSSSSWHLAMQLCNKDGGNLVSIETQEEQTFIENLIKRTLGIQGISRRDNMAFWIGGHDITREGQWKWEATGKTFTFTNWYRGQPDNYRGGEDCAEIWEGFKWNDDICGDNQHYICEI